MSWFSKMSKPIPFLDAVMAGKVNDVRKHLEAGINPNEKVDNGRAYPLHFAVHAGIEMVELLIKYGAKVNVKDEYGQTPLHLAGEAGHLDIVRLLIQSGADVNITNNEGHTPLFTTATEVSPYDMIHAATKTPPSERALREKSGREAVVSFLKSHGAHLSEKDKEILKTMS